MKRSNKQPGIVILKKLRKNTVLLNQANSQLLTSLFKQNPGERIHFWKMRREYTTLF